jgi:SAM-dependent methyltransferase
MPKRGTSLLDSLPIERQWDRLNRDLSNEVNSELAKLSDVKILEAGCGRRWLLNLPDTNYSLTGVDRDEKALQSRIEDKKDLDEAIVGDLETISLPHDEFNMIYSSYVLEHIANAEKLLNRMLDWLRPGGILVLKIPIRESVFGFVTRVSPYWIHVLYHKYVLRLPNAGKPGHSPYPTYYHAVVSLQGMQQYADKNGLQIVFATSTDFAISKNSLVQLASKVFCSTLSVLSLGRLVNTCSGLVLVLKKTI